MSASLVGSEMCIRDRPPKQPFRPRGPALHPKALLCVERQHFTPQGREPVSYTHLTLPTICSV
eukprot:8118814-Alexandrium_andersonii.AAC.1